MAPNGSCFAVNVYSHERGVMKFIAQKDDRVKKINEQISSKTKVPVENQMLLLDSKALNPEEKLSSYWLDSGTTISLTLKVVPPSDEELPASQKEVDEEKEQPSSIQPSSSVSQVKEGNVHSQGQELMKFTAQKDDRVKKINEQISSKTKVPLENQSVLLGSAALNPEKKSSPSGLDPSTTIHRSQKVVEPSDKELKMFLIEADKGKKHEFYIRPSTSVAQLENLIQAKTTMSPQAQRLYYNGKMLEYGKTIADYLMPMLNTFFSTRKCIGG